MCSFAQAASSAESYFSRKFLDGASLFSETSFLVHLLTVLERPAELL